MPTPTKGTRLGGSSAHEQLMLANLATSLFEHGKITTTETKAKRVRPLAEKLITKAKRGDLHNRRQIMRVIRDKDVVHRLMTEIGPFFVDRNGGYVRITRTLPRKGDNAPMAVIELVSEKTVTAEAEAARKTRFAKDRPAANDTSTEQADSAGKTSQDTELEEAKAEAELESEKDQDTEAPVSATKEATADPAEGADDQEADPAEKREDS